MAVIFTPRVGNAYSFKFETKYAKANGIYKTDAILSYDEYVADGRDIVEDFYAICGLGETEAAQDDALLRKSLIIRVSPPDDNTTIKVTHFPFCFVSDTPDFNVSPYSTFGLVLYSGITDNIDRLEYLREHVAQMFKASLGIDAKPYWVQIGTKWMTEEEYGKILASQQAAAKHTLNYYTENLRLQKSYDAMAAKVTAYEDIIVKLQKQVDDLKAQISPPGEAG